MLSVRRLGFSATLAGMGLAALLIGTRLEASTPAHADAGAISAVLSFVQAQGGYTITPQDPSTLTGTVISMQTADAVALHQEPAGSTVITAFLASVTNQATGHSGLCWVVSVDPAGGRRSDGGAVSANFELQIIDAKSGFGLTRIYGNAPSAPPLTPIS